MSRKSFIRRFHLITINEAEVHHQGDSLIEDEEHSWEGEVYDSTFVDAVEDRIQVEEQVKVDSLSVEIIREVFPTVVGRLYEGFRPSIIVECHFLIEEDSLKEATQI